MKFPLLVWTQWVSVASALLLALGALHLPIGYYTFLRVMVFITCAVLIWKEQRDTDPHMWSLVFIPIGVLFNPIVPIHTNNKTAWIFIDIGCAAVFCAYVLHPILIRREPIN